MYRSFSPATEYERTNNVFKALLNLMCVFELYEWCDLLKVWVDPKCGPNVCQWKNASLLCQNWKQDPSFAVS